MLKHGSFVTFLIVIFISGCSGDDGAQKTTVKGTITVADSIDSSHDYSGIGVTIIKKDSANANADTLYHALTDEKGTFKGEAEFEYKRQYPLLISRNDQTLGQTGVILAPDDTVRITAELPGVNQTIQIYSHEHDVLQSYRRVEKGFRRVGVFARAGRLKGDSLANELKKWPDIYWDIYEENPNTLGGELAAKKTIELLHSFDPDKMMQKIHAIENRDDLVFLAATYGKEYMAKKKYLDQTLDYLSDLEKKTEQKPARMRIAIERIALLYDSAKVEQARTELKSFRKKFDNKIANDWAQSMKYDLSYLSPGDPIPDFSFTDNGETISREKLKGHAYLLEITSLTNPIYQRQYDRTVVIHSLYKNYDFNIVTIPLDTSKVTVDAFFEQRVRPWPVAPANAFNSRELIKRFNIKNLPTRFLVDRQGRIVRRYVGQEYKDVIQGIQKIFKNK